MKPVIEVKNLAKEFIVQERGQGMKETLKALFHSQKKKVEAVKGISLEIKEGELVGFIGSNGAGKTTTLKMLCGLLYPTSGEIGVLGHTPFQRRPEFLKQISLVMGQKNQLWWDLPAIETFYLNKTVYGIPDAEYKEMLEELVEMLDIKDVIHRQVRRLSLGQRMKCELVVALLHRPKVLFLDEPTIGLDVVMQKKVRQFIKQYVQIV